ncbi:hypothetical protein [Desulfurivibrio dismutans]|nr:hypothetical protein [Desulfurivibrio alkaliphilus]MDF1613782.1 hypothetical protein [Desulfurivibrio alkaliphilus]
MDFKFRSCIANHYLLDVQSDRLKNPVCSLTEQQFTITGALDFLFQRF